MGGGREGLGGSSYKPKGGVGRSWGAGGSNRHDPIANLLFLILFELKFFNAFHVSVLDFLKF